MRPEVAAADRNHEIREAARAWRRATVIDDPTLEAVLRRWPDDRRRLGPVFRALVAFFTFVALVGFIGIFIAAASPSESGLGHLLLFFGTALGVMTDLQIGPLRRREGGTEAATALLGVVLLWGGIGMEIGNARLGSRTSLACVCAAGAVVCAAAAWRWGYRLAAVVAAVAAYGVLAALPAARLTWVAAVVTVPALLAAGRSPRLPPAHRRSAEAAAMVALLALYAALHLTSWDYRLLELLWRVGDVPATPPSGPARVPFMLATALLPVAVLAAGIRLRHVLLLQVGVLLAAATLVTMRFYVHVAPVWVVLTAGGIALVALALALQRWLDAGSARERAGFTAAPLFDRAKPGLVELAGAVASFAPAARAIPQEPEGFKGGGGDFGGGGASSSF